MSLISSYSAALRTIFLCAILIPTLVVLDSCTPTNSKPSTEVTQPEEDYIYHRIKYSGESVAVISAWYTKSAKNWPEIVDANPKMIPSKLRIGDLVRIPKRLVRRFKSLPQDFVVSFKSGVNQDSSKNSKSTSGGVEDSGSARDKGNDFKMNNSEVTIEEDVGTKSKESSRNNKEDIHPDNENKIEDSSPATEERMPAAEPVEEPLKKPEVDINEKPAEVPAKNDENQKIRDQLMQELLQ